MLPGDQWDGYCQPQHALAHAAHVRRLATLAWMKAHPKERPKVIEGKKKALMCVRCGEWLIGRQRKFCSDACKENRQEEAQRAPERLPCETCVRGKRSQHAVNGWECGPGLWLRCKPEGEMRFYERVLS